MPKNPVIAYVLAIVQRGTEYKASKKLLDINDVTETLVTYGSKTTILS